MSKKESKSKAKKKLTLRVHQETVARITRVAKLADTDIDTVVGVIVAMSLVQAEGKLPSEEA